MSKTTVDWFKWAKIKTIILDDACGLLAGIDLSAHRWIRNHWEEQASLYKDHDDRPDRGYMDSWRKELDDNVEEIIIKQKIMEVVQNHIQNDCFIPMELKEISEQEFKKNHPFDEIPEGEKAGYWVVNLAEFGTWAKSAGFDLPAEFPVTESKTNEYESNSADEAIDSSLLPKFFDTSGLINGRFFYESRLTNGRLDGNELRECSANEYLDKLVIFCKTNEVSLDEGLRQLLDHLMGKRTDKTFLTLYETALSMLKDYEKINKTSQPAEPNEPKQATEILGQPTSKTKPVCKISLTARIEEELKDISVSSIEILIPRGQKANIAKKISADSDKVFTQKQVEDKVAYLGYKSENQPSVKK